MSTTKHTEEKDKGSLPGEPLPGEPPVKEQKNAPQPGPPVALKGGSETEGDLIIIRGQGPLLYEGVYGEGPIIETITPEEQTRRKGDQEARSKEERESALADVEARKGFKEPRGKEASHEDWKPADLSKEPKAEKAKAEEHKPETHKAEEKSKK